MMRKRSRTDAFVVARSRMSLDKLALLGRAAEADFALVLDSGGLPLFDQLGQPPLPPRAGRLRPQP